MASVAKRPRTKADGTNGDRWIVRYVDGGGKHRQATFERKKEAEAYRAKVAALAAEAGPRGSFRDATVREAAAEYERYNDRRLADGQIKRSYLKHVDTVMRVSIMPTLGPIRLSEIDSATLVRWFHGLRDGGICARTAMDRLILFSGLWKFARRARLARGDNPVSEALEHIRRLPKTRIRTLSATEVQTLLQAAEQRRPGGRGRVWWVARIAVNLAAFSGLRIGEILALRVPDLDLAGRNVHVRHTLNRWDELTPPKSRDSVRTVPIPEHVAALLGEWLRDHYREDDRQLLFRGYGDQRFRINQINFQRAYWHPLVLASGILKDGEKSIHFHALRHFAASWWLKNRLPVTDAAKLMGHADASVTMRIYSHELMEEAERLAAFDTMATALRSASDAHGLRMAEKALEYQPAD